MFSPATLLLLKPIMSILYYIFKILSLSINAEHLSSNIQWLHNEYQFLSHKISSFKGRPHTRAHQFLVADLNELLRRLSSYLGGIAWETLLVAAARETTAERWVLGIGTALLFLCRDLLQRTDAFDEWNFQVKSSGLRVVVCIVVLVESILFIRILINVFREMFCFLL